MYAACTRPGAFCGRTCAVPRPICTALAGTASAVATATADTLVAADIYNLQNQRSPRFQDQNPQWAANLAILNTARQFQTTNGAALVFPALQNDPPTLLGQPVHQISNMKATMGGGAGNDPILVYGDWSQFVLVDRWPSMLEVVPHLFGPNRRPTGQRGFLLHSRVGSDVLVDNAFRVLTA